MALTHAAYWVQPPSITKPNRGSALNFMVFSLAMAYEFALLVRIPS